MQQIYVIGDLHGDSTPVKQFCYRNRAALSLNPVENNILICLGDFGGQFFFNDTDARFKRQLSKMNLTYFVIRGNHEERPSICMAKNLGQWHTEKFFNNTVFVENDFPNIKYALDTPSCYQIGGYRTYVYPGAYSIDKARRVALGYGWFPGEQMTEEEKVIGEKLAETPCDLVLSHTCPLAWQPVDLFLSSINQASVDISTENYLGAIEYKLQYSAWLWGHFHQFRDYPRGDNSPKRTMLFNQEVINLDQYMNSNFVDIF